MGFFGTARYFGLSLQINTMMLYCGLGKLEELRRMKWSGIL